MMNTTSSYIEYDPRLEIVPIAYLSLAANLLSSKRQDLEYWATVPIPCPPTDRVDFEEVRQIAVFLPLVLVALVFDGFHFTGAAVTFLLVLPLMKMQHDSLIFASAERSAAWHRRDCGRHAFTIFMGQRFRLLPEEVTMLLVLKMCHDLKQCIEATDGVTAHNKVTKLNSGRAESIEQVDGYDHAVMNGGRHTIFSNPPHAVRASQNPASTLPTVNPVTGLPMITETIDVHGNVYGTSSVDDLFEDMGQEYAHVPSFGNSGVDSSFQEFGTAASIPDGFGAE